MFFRGHDRRPGSDDGASPVDSHLLRLGVSIGQSGMVMFRSSVIRDWKDNRLSLAREHLRGILKASMSLVCMYGIEEHKRD